MHWLTMSLEKVIPATELFSTFRTRILSAETDAEALIKELCADAAVMRSFDSPEPKSPEAEFFNWMAALDAGTLLPVVLLLFRSPEVNPMLFANTPTGAARLVMSSTQRIDSCRPAPAAYYAGWPRYRCARSRVAGVSRSTLSSAVSVSR
jgi:hypothetical protein